MRDGSAMYPIHHFLTSSDQAYLDAGYLRLLEVTTARGAAIRSRGGQEYSLENRASDLSDHAWAHFERTAPGASWEGFQPPEEGRRDARNSSRKRIDLWA